MRFNLLIVTWFETLRWQFTTPGRSLILQWCYGIWHSSAQMLATITFGVHAYCTYLLYLYQIEIYIISKQISPIHYSPFWPQGNQKSVLRCWYKQRWTVTLLTNRNRHTCSSHNVVQNNDSDLSMVTTHCVSFSLFTLKYKIPGSEYSWTTTVTILTCLLVRFNNRYFQRISFVYNAGDGWG